MQILKMPKMQHVPFEAILDCIKSVAVFNNIRMEKLAARDNVHLYDNGAFKDLTKTIEINNILYTEEGKKTIGLFILRANGFSDNNIDFSSAQAATFWLDMIDEITLRGYDYELLTSGHFGDEAFVDYLTRFRKVKRRKCVFYLDSPEKLISKI